MSPVMAISRARTNADLMLEVVELGHLSREMVTLDPTFGRGRFWTKWRPSTLIACDLDPSRSPIGYPVDFTELHWPDRCFDAVVLDPPYKLNGTGGSHPSDDAYGVATTGVSWQDRHALVEAGIVECARVTNDRLLIKCQDQVASGAVRWQTRIFADVAESVGCRLVEMVHLPGHRAQPEWQACRRCQRTGHERIRVSPVCTSCGGAGWFRPTQAHAHRNYSTLLICRKGRRRP